MLQLFFDRGAKRWLQPYDMPMQGRILHEMCRKVEDV